MITTTSPTWLPDDHHPLFYPGVPGARVVLTKQLREVRAGVKTLTTEGGLVLIDGEPGLGKSFATDVALADLDIERIWIAMPDRPRGKETIARIWTALSGRRINSRVTELALFEDVVELLNGRKLALVIDEGQHLQSGPLRQLRYLYDHQQTTLLMVIVGSGVGASVMRACPELYNRIDRLITFDPLSVTEAVETARAMHPIYENATPAALQLLWHSAGGCVRSWASLLRTLITLDACDDEPLTEELVEVATRINNTRPIGTRSPKGRRT